MDVRHVRRPGDGWLDCACGQKHWGLHGAAGLLLARSTPSDDDATHLEVVLQHRAVWSHHGGTWGVPGGAIAPDESPTEGALREAREEAGIETEDVEVRTSHVLDHGTWSYTTVVATLRPGAPGAVREADDESLEVRWVPLEAVAALPLLPAFADAWPGLRERLERLAAPSSGSAARRP